MKLKQTIQSLTSSIDNIIRSTLESKGHEDAFYVVDIPDILKKHKTWLINMPRVRPFYAVKCNTSAIVLELLAALGLGFDCASKAEIDTILGMGVTADRIIYANPCKTKGYIRHAHSVGVDLMTFDNEPELYKVAQINPKARLVLRIKVDDSHSVCQFSAKFGAGMESVWGLLTTAKKLGLNVVGVSFHVGSGCESASSFRDAIENARKVFDLGSKLGFDMNLLDLGGGWPGTSNPAVRFEDMARVVTSALDQFFPEEDECGNKVNLDIIAEPGRFYVASAFSLITMVIAKRVGQENGSKKVMYYLNDGVYGSFNCTIFDHIVVEATPYLTEEEQAARPVSKSTIWGPTCDSMDLILKDVPLTEMEVGEWIVFKEMGAYTIAAASTFNGFQVPEMLFFAPFHTLEALKQLPRWHRIAETLKIEDESMLSSDEEEFMFEDFDHMAIAVH